MPGCMCCCWSSSYGHVVLLLLLLLPSAVVVEAALVKLLGAVQLAERVLLLGDNGAAGKPARGWKQW